LTGEHFHILGDRETSVPDTNTVRSQSSRMQVMLYNTSVEVWLRCLLYT